MADGVRYAGEVTTEFNVDKRTRRLQDRSEFSRAVASLRNKIKEEGPGFLLDGKSNGDSCTASAQGQWSTIQGRPHIASRTVHPLCLNLAVLNDRMTRRFLPL
jgi:hypothetical protein